MRVTKRRDGSRKARARSARSASAAGRQRRTEVRVSELETKLASHQLQSTITPATAACQLPAQLFLPLLLLNSGTSHPSPRPSQPHSQPKAQPQHPQQYSLRPLIPSLTLTPTSHPLTLSRQSNPGMPAVRTDKSPAPTATNFSSAALLGAKLSSHGPQFAPSIERGSVSAPFVFNAPGADPDGRSVGSGHRKSPRTPRFGPIPLTSILRCRLQACRLCKHRKIRCDGVRPVCGSCMKSATAKGE